MVHKEKASTTKRLLYIQHTLIRLNGEYIRETTKTEDSTRRIMLPDYIIEW